ncbi:hypothetical protein [Catenibacterium sp.]
MVESAALYALFTFFAMLGCVVSRNKQIREYMAKISHMRYVGI